MDGGYDDKSLRRPPSHHSLVTGQLALNDQQIQAANRMKTAMMVLVALFLAAADVGAVQFAFGR